MFDKTNIKDLTDEQLDIVAELLKARVLKGDMEGNLSFILEEGTYVSYPAGRNEYGFANFIRLEGGTAILKSISYDEEILRIPLMQICNQEAEVKEIKRSKVKEMKKIFNMEDENDEEFIQWWRRNHGTGYEIKIVEG